MPKMLISVNTGSDITLTGDLAEALSDCELVTEAINRLIERLELIKKALKDHDNAVASNHSGTQLYIAAWDIAGASIEAIGMTIEEVYLLKRRKIVYFANEE